MSVDGKDVQEDLVMYKVISEVMLPNSQPIKLEINDLQSELGQADYTDVELAQIQKPADR
jgi:hypothetical protein